MREIVLQPGTSIEIDGVVVRAADPARVSFGCAPMVYDPHTGEYSREVTYMNSLVEPATPTYQQLFGYEATRKV